MPRTILNDEHWSNLSAMMLKDRVYDKPEHRNTMEGILYRMRTGCPWRDVPKSFGDWSAIDCERLTNSTFLLLTFNFIVASH